MLTLSLVMFFVAFALLVFALVAFSSEQTRPTLNLQDFSSDGSFVIKPKEKPQGGFASLDNVSVFLRPLITSNMRRRLSRDLGIARLRFSPETFFLLKIILFGLIMLLLPGMVPPEKMLISTVIALFFSYMLPELWLGAKVKAGKSDFVKLLPDVVDLLGLCVSAGLDFMMALKWVVDKAPYNIVVEEMTILLQEISIGKPRRDALRDLAKKYELPDLSTFTRTLIQADKMGTSVSEALTILSEDMRLARFRRGEAMALKAPLKMLVPLLFFIFPVVGILVGGPIFMEFMSGSAGTIGK